MNLLGKSERTMGSAAWRVNHDGRVTGTRI